MPDSKDPNRWVEYAENDYQAAFQLKDNIASSSAFLFHAAVEKYLKAVLLHKGKKVPQIHDIAKLLELVEPQLQTQSREQQAAKLLDIIFNFSRYPDDLLEMGLEETSSIHQASTVLRAYARGELGLEGDL
jgi:HEPN domain-containing protein